MFSVLVEAGIMERIHTLPHQEAASLKKRLRLLKVNPFPDGGDKKEIKGSQRSAYRLRVGRYRFFYLIDTEKKLVKVTEFLTAEQAHKKYRLV